MTRDNSCPRCGTRLTKQSGFWSCSNCGHTVGLFRRDWIYESASDGRPIELGHIRPTNSDTVRYTTESRHPRRRRNQPLTGKDP